MKAKNAISKIALENGMSARELIEIMQSAIDEGLSSGDPAVIKLWEKVPRKGEKPDPEEFIDYIAGNIRGK
ncbi:MAG: hypothetical protein NC395_10480 [Prevotella sp.]|nr:hypothetical protein [Prevotella sp.]